MEVNHTSDHVTHAVIGGLKPIAMSISDSPEFFQVLSSSLYTNQRLAVIRETLCNAWDAHIDAGITEIPFHITMDTEKLVLRDFGKGIPHDLIGPIYGTYGDSTKVNDGKQTGGFGLGCKAPYCYTDHFQVVSNHQGIRTIYNMSKSSAQMGGKPAIIPIASFPTTETGLEVTINIKRTDYGTLSDMIEMIARNGEMNVIFNGKALQATPYSHALNDFAIHAMSPTGSGEAGCTIKVRYGNVIYPLPNHADLTGYKQAIVALEKLPNNHEGFSYSSGNFGTACLVLLAPPHSISVTPSREALSLQEHTINTVNILLGNFLACLNKPTEALDNTILNETLKDAPAYKLLEQDIPIKNPLFPREMWLNNKLTITNLESYRRAKLFRLGDTTLASREAFMRLSMASKKGLFLRGKGQSIIREFARSKSKRYGSIVTRWVHDHIVKPIVRKMVDVPELSPSRLFFLRMNGCVHAVASTRKILVNGVGTMETVHPHYQTILAKAPKYARPYVILHYIRKDVSDRVEKEGTLKGPEKYETLFYHVPRVQARVEAAITFFESLGYMVIDLTKPLLGETAAAVAPKVPVVSDTKKQIGLIKLSSAKKNGYFRTRLLFEDSAERVKEPKALTLCTDSADMGQANKVAFFGSHSALLAEMYGDKIGVAKSRDQYTRYNQKGIIDAIEYVEKDVIDYVKNSPMLNEYLIMQDTVNENHLDSNLFDYLRSNESLCKHYGIPFLVDPKDKQYLSMWEFLLRHRRYAVNGVENVLHDLKQMPAHAASVSFCEALTNSKYLPLIEMGFSRGTTVTDAVFIAFIDFVTK